MNEKKKVQYKIYQIRDIRGTEYGFMGWGHAEEKFDFSDYKEVYSGEIDQENCLDNLFEIFNLSHPAGFKGHSLSVSDVIGIKTEGNDHYYWYYCDSFSWKEITELIERSEEKSEATSETMSVSNGIRNEINNILEEAIENAFIQCQTKLGIKSGDILPPDEVKLLDLRLELTNEIAEVLDYQARSTAQER